MKPFMFEIAHADQSGLALQAYLQAFHQQPYSVTRCKVHVAWELRAQTFSPLNYSATLNLTLSAMYMMKLKQKMLSFRTWSSLTAQMYMMI